MQSVLIIECFICKVSLLLSASYAKQGSWCHVCAQTPTSTSSTSTMPVQPVALFRKSCKGGGGSLLHVLAPLPCYVEPESWARGQKLAPIPTPDEQLQMQRVWPVAPPVQSVHPTLHMIPQFS